MKNTLLPAFALFVLAVAVSCDRDDPVNPSPNPDPDPITDKVHVRDTVGTLPPYDTAAAIDGRVWRYVYYTSGRDYQRNDTVFHPVETPLVVTTTWTDNTHFTSHTVNTTGYPTNGFVDGKSYRYILRRVCDVQPEQFPSDTSMLVVFLPADAPASDDTATGILDHAYYYEVLSVSDTLVTIFDWGYPLRDESVNSHFFRFRKVSPPIVLD